MARSHPPTEKSEGPKRGKPLLWLETDQRHRCQRHSSARRFFALSRLWNGPHSTELRGGACHRLSKAPGCQDLDIEEPVLSRYASAFHFHPTLAGMLGSTLIGVTVQSVQIVTVSSSFKINILQWFRQKS